MRLTAIGRGERGRARAKVRARTPFIIYPKPPIQAENLSVHPGEPGGNFW